MTGHEKRANARSFMQSYTGGDNSQTIATDNKVLGNTSNSSINSKLESKRTITLPEMTEKNILLAILAVNFLILLILINK